MYNIFIFCSSLPKQKLFRRYLLTILVKHPNGLKQRRGGGGGDQPLCAAKWVHNSAKTVDVWNCKLVSWLNIVMKWHNGPCDQPVMGLNNNKRIYYQGNIKDEFLFSFIFSFKISYPQLKTHVFAGHGQLHWLFMDNLRLHEKRPFHRAVLW